VDLRFDSPDLARYVSKSQVARVATQRWVGRELPCPRCSTSPLQPTAENTKSRDFVCSNCDEPFELKSKAGRFTRWVVDGEYRTFLDSVLSGRTPNLILLEYDPNAMEVARLEAIHRTLLSPLAIVARKPLSQRARRAGWQGCNLDLSTVPVDGRVAIVSNGEVRPWPEVTEAWSRFEFMIRIRPDSRGWLRDVLACVQQLPSAQFTLDQVYSFERELTELHPSNRNVRPKIRQQLQILVAQGLLARARPGLYLRTPAEVPV